MPTHLMATCVARPDDIPEAEPVLVDVVADVVRLELPDGAVYELDRVELHTATQPGKAAA